jgi:hypothetical protein
LLVLAGPSSVGTFVSLNLSTQRKECSAMNVKALLQSVVTVLVVMAIVNRVPQLKAITG